MGEENGRRWAEQEGGGGRALSSQRTLANFLTRSVSRRRRNGKNRKGGEREKMSRERRTGRDGLVARRIPPGQLARIRGGEQEGGLRGNRVLQVQGVHVEQFTGVLMSILGTIFEELGPERLTGVLMTIFGELDLERLTDVLMIILGELSLDRLAGIRRSPYSFSESSV